MDPLKLDLPADSQFTNRLYASKDAGYLLQDLVVVRLPNGVIIDAGWYPEHDPEGEYVIRVYSPNWSEQIGPLVTTNRPLEVREIVEDLAKRFSKGVTSWSASSGTLSQDFRDEEVSSNWLVAAS